MLQSRSTREQNSAVAWRENLWGNGRGVFGRVCFFKRGMIWKNGDIASSIFDGI
jgi:hypothetical protein